MDTKKSGVSVGGGGGWVEVEEGIVGMNDGKNKKNKINISKKIPGELASSSIEAPGYELRTREKEESWRG